MPVVLIINDSGTLKRNIVQLAREFCSISGYDLEETPEEGASHLRELNAMMFEHPWNTLGYNQPTYGTGLLEDQSGIPDSAISAVSKYLGLRIAPGLFKLVSPDAKAALIRSYNLLFAQTATIPSMPRRNTPRGRGNEWMQPWWPYINDCV